MKSNLAGHDDDNAAAVVVMEHELSGDRRQVAYSGED